MTSGGTGGHVFPALATAMELSASGADILFATDLRGEKYLANTDYRYKLISSAGLGGNALKKLLAATKIFKGLAESVSLILKYKPDVVIGFGGYTTFPILLAAKLLRKKIIIHEQNSVMGKVNRQFLKNAVLVGLSFPDTKYTKIGEVFGNPVRKEIEFSPLPALGDKIKILITGGSQGARIFAKFFPESFHQLAHKISVVHQVPEIDIEALRNEYERLGIEAELKPFFDDMPKRLAEAHLVICRSGSSTVFELTAAGRPAIFVPLAIAADNHQMVNAQNIERIGGGWIIPEQEATIAKFEYRVKDLVENPAKLVEASNAIHEFAQNDAARKFAQGILKIISNGAKK